MQAGLFSAGCRHLFSAGCWQWVVQDVVAEYKWTKTCVVTKVEGPVAYEEGKSGSVETALVNERRCV